MRLSARLRGTAGPSVAAGIAALAICLPVLAAACAGARTAGTADFRDRIPGAWPVPVDERPAVGRRAMVATNEDLATRVGVDVLRAGGNAADAAVAVGFALAVVHPLAGNLGGGGFAVVRTAAGEEAALDFRETAPLAATREMFIDEPPGAGKRSWTGHLASGVPGTVAGLWELHGRFGSRPWAELLEPAIRLAAGGFAVPAMFERSVDRVAGRMAPFPASVDLFLDGGTPPAAGSRWSNPDLAATLRRIAAGGPDGFYSGRTADLLVAEMRRGGGLITHADLARYEAKWRAPVRFDYRGYRWISMPPPSSGGLVHARIAATLEPYDLAAKGWHSTEAVHLAATALRDGFAERNRLLGDPDFVEIPYERFLAPGGRAAAEVPNEAPGRPADADSSTTHYSIVDPAGNAVSLTTTLNGWYGSCVTVAGAGFPMNNEMNDFTLRPGMENRYGLVQGEANAIAPGKRMLSSMSPTIVLDPDGELFLVTGAAGGSRIISAVFQIVSNVVDFEMGLTAAVNAPRFHHQHLPDLISFEPDGLPEPLQAGLRELGHEVEPSRGFLGIAPTVMRRAGVWIGAGEPHRRIGGSARGF